MLLFCDSFFYPSSEIFNKWSSSATPTYWNISSTAGRRNNNAIVCTYPGSALTKNLEVQSAIIITGFGIFNRGSLTQSAVFQALEGSNLQASVEVLADGSIRANGASNPFISVVPSLTSLPNLIKSGVYAYLEVKVKVGMTAGSITVKVDNVVVLEFLNIRTQNYTDAGYITVVKYDVASRNFLGPNSGSICDLYICNGLGPASNDFLGDIRVDYRPVVGNGSVNQYTAPNGDPHWSLVSNNNIVPTTYLTSSLLGDRELFKISALPSLPGSIKGIQITSVAYRGESGSMAIRNSIKSGSEIVDSPSMPLSTSKSQYRFIQEINPANGLPWTTSSLSTVEVGVITSS
jgi:hypothetical protein